MSANWIKSLQESDSRLHKEEVLRKAVVASNLGSENADTFLTLAGLCYNPYVTFGVRQVPNIINSLSQKNPWEEFKELLNNLDARLLTGNAAHEAIYAMSARFSVDEWNLFCAPVIRRDLRAGISVTTLNKILKNTKYVIPVFGCQLATNSEGRPEMSGTKRIEPKLDGVRVIIEVVSKFSGYSITCYSRNGKIFENFGHITSQINMQADKMISLMGPKIGNMSSGFVLDGEVIGNTFQELMRQARRKENVQATDSVFNIFDVMPLSDFREGHCNAQLRKRIEILENIRPLIDMMPNVELLPHVNIDLDTEEGKSELQRYATAQVEAGFEGIMIKELEAPYECKRNTFWMKWKPTTTVDLKVVALEEGTGRNQGRLGALVCEGVDDGKHIKVNVGSGFSDNDRTTLWADHVELDCIVDKTAEVLCDIITQNQDGTYSLRFPRFVRFRDDKQEA
jgi:DNA ligase-1